ncbi:MAG TPA: M14 family metallopeptidase [bacterium]|nr:M14 family metallopeptidase [bacterium]HXK92906.1 M14 family metallopeptidase [bacterium]
MKRFCQVSLALGLGGWVWAGMAAGAETASWPDLRTYHEVSQALRSWSVEHADILRLSSLARTREGREVWVCEIGRGTGEERRQRPAMLIVSGVEGPTLAGNEYALGFIESLCQTKGEAEVNALLDSVTIYVVPCLNPDAAERFFASPRMEQTANLNPFDQDHDGLVDEDGPDDLDGDGRITWLRVRDPKGTFTAHPEDGRILIEADSAKAEAGRWLYFREGLDNDEDEKINEDPAGGVNLNANFPFEYPQFGADAGLHPMSEPETRSLAEFIIAHPHIGLVFTFCGQGNLLKKPESGERSSGRNPQTKIRNEDAAYYEFLGEQYRERLGIAKAVETEAAKGSFADWMYFHRGRLSLSTPPWSPGIALALKKDATNDVDAGKDETQPAKREKETQEKAVEPEKVSESGDSKKVDPKKEDTKEEKRGKEEKEYLEWLDRNAPDYFVPWKSIEHPSYPGQEAEAGGFAPYAKVLPPKPFFAELKEKNIQYLLWLAGKLPRIGIDEIQVKSLGMGVYEITARIINTGYLPTMPAHGERTGEILPTRVEISLPPEAILAGEKKARIGPVAGSGGVEELHYVVQGKEGQEVTIEVISALAGNARKSVTLTGKGE